MSRSALDTPMMRQYRALKAGHPDAILFYRMGDFYEMFLEDAELAAPLLDIALTTRDKGKPDAVPMCGVPVHAADGHIKRLAELGHRVAICEQVEDPRAAGRRLVKREVVEVVTPGLAGDPAGIEARRELAIAALSGGRGLAVLDASTGRFRATAAGDGSGADALATELLQELVRVDPRELLVPESIAPELRVALAQQLPQCAVTPLADACFDPGSGPQPAGLERAPAPAAATAAVALYRYVGENQPFALAQAGAVEFYGLADAMILDAATTAHLELFRNSEDGTRERTLIERIDASVTPLGARRLAAWLAYPLVDASAVAARQEGVAWFVERDRPRARLREALRPVRDLERLFAKAARPTSSPRDLAALRDSLAAVPEVAARLGEDDAERLAGVPDQRPAVVAAPPAVDELALHLGEALVDEPAALPRGSRGALETGYVRDGFHSELTGLREAVSKGREWIAGLEAEERERTGISGLKIRFHPVHGYFIEVSKANLARVPGDYERKQTLANAERFTTEPLREVEQKVRGATERAAALEREILESLRETVREHAARVREAAAGVATLDALAALAEVARRERWVRPRVGSDEALVIRGGRHPVVEPLLVASGAGEFVANDTRLAPDGTQLLVITGPNMSGKSTYLRQVALIVLLAQMGSWVPAEEASVGVVDRVFTRIGASDRLARGESTFMVEMREMAEILANATPRSLLILDEIGRGTSTFDGLSIAWAVAEHLHDAPGLRARTLFATHYHELTELAQTLVGVDNAHFQAKEWGDDVIFLRRLEPGGANRSYGIQVARLAGLPEAVIARARAILANLEGGEFDARGRPRLIPAATGEAAEPQLGLFAAAGGARPGEADALAELRAFDADRTTPLEALALLARLSAGLRGEEDA